MALKLKTAAATYPISLADAKKQLRLPSAFVAEDDALNWYIQAATAIAERETNRALISQTWTLTLDRFPKRIIECSKNPLIAVTSVKYINTAGTETTLETTDYITDNQHEPWRLSPAYGKSWPATQNRINAVSIEFTAGYSSTVPDNILQGMRLIIGDMYRNRENIIIGRIVSDIPRNAINLFHLERIDDHHTNCYN